MGVLALAAVSANAELIWGITVPGANGSNLISFDSANPGGFTTGATLTGVLAAHTIRAIDFRPSDGQLYAVSSTGATAQLYTVDLATGALTTVGSTFTLTGNTSARISLDFNPVVDLLRVVTGTGQNARVDPGTGSLVSMDTSLSSSLLISGIAYSDNNVGASSTTLYGYDFVTDNVGTIGGLNGVPSPNGGTFNVVGNSGIVTGDAGLGFDISGATGTAYVTVDDFNGSPGVNAEFFTLNLGTGGLTQVGADDIFPVLDISVAPVPVPEPATMFALGIGALALIRRKRKN